LEFGALAPCVRRPCYVALSPPACRPRARIAIGLPLGMAWVAAWPRVASNIDFTPLYVHDPLAPQGVRRYPALPRARDSMLAINASSGTSRPARIDSPPPRLAKTSKSLTAAATSPERAAPESTPSN